MSAPGIADCPKGFEFAEMNLKHTGNEELTLNLVKRAIRMGYDTVIINRDIGDPFPPEEDSEAPVDEPPKKKKKKGGKVQDSEERRLIAMAIPDPFLVDESKLNLSILEKSGRRFRQYSRLTVSLNESSCVHTLLNNSQLKKYDLIAVRPGDESILNTLTRKTDHIDIVTYVNDTRIPWIMKQKLIDAIRTEGVGFEIEYASALGDSYSRRLFLSNARLLLQSTRRRGVVFASGAETLVNLRAPVDAMNMTLLFGVEGNKAKRYISDNCRQILLRAEAKRTVKGSLAVRDGDKVPSKKKSAEDALRRLLAVPEFRCEIERIPQANSLGEKNDVE